MKLHRTKVLNIDIESRSDFNGIIAGLNGSVEQNCPLLFNILEIILLHRDVVSMPKMRIKSAIDTIAIFVSLGSQKNEE